MKRAEREHGQGRLVVAGVLLLALAGASFWLSYLRLGAWGLPVALLIAALKSLLVIGIFMELWREAASVRLAALAALLMLALLASLTVADVATRARPALAPPDPAALSLD